MPHSWPPLAATLRRLQPLRIEDKPIFDAHACIVGVRYSDYSFANNLCWCADQRYMHGMFEGCFCLFALRGNDLSMVLPPLGPASQQAAAVRDCLTLMAQSNPSRCGVIRYVYKDLVAVLAADSPTGMPPSDYEITPERPDYIYRTADLVDLRGSGLKSKRNEINQFLRVCPQPVLVPLTPSLHDAVLTFSQTWVDQHVPAHDEAYAATAQEELRAIAFTLDHMAALAVQGCCLYANDQLMGFAIYERLPQGGGHVLFEKVTRTPKGASQYLFREYCRSLLDCAEITTGDDLNIDSLRLNKESYRPIRMGEKVRLQLSL